MHIRILSPSLDEFMRDGEKVIVLRGIIDPQCLSGIRAATYQREVLRGPKQNNLMEAVRLSAVPDVELGVRGKNFTTEGSGDGEVAVIKHDVYVVDGLQRISAGVALIAKDATQAPRIGATIHFETNEEWERARFKVLNQDRTRVSPNVLLRNEREVNGAIGLIYNLTHTDDAFVLHRRVQWGQLRARGEMITALNVIRLAGILHSNFSRGGRSNSVPEIMESGAGIEGVMTAAGKVNFRENIRYFFDLIDECWGVKRVTFVDKCTHMKGGFLVALAELLLRHKEFWKESRLFVDKPTRKKLARFNTSDPEVVRLAGSNGKASVALYVMLLDHVNSGRRSNRLSSPLEDEEARGESSEE